MRISAQSWSIGRPVLSMADHEPVYRYSLREAIRNEEQDLWRESLKESCDCARAIERAIGENYHDNRLVHQVTRDEYGDRCQEVEIYLKYIGKIEIPEEPMPEPTPEELKELERIRRKRASGRKYYYKKKAELAAAKAAEAATVTA